MTRPSFSDIKSANERIEQYRVKTPLISHRFLDEISGCKLFIKDETKQKTGSFKYRGARSRLSLLSEAEKAKGVVAFSSGNHAQGVAMAAKELGISAVIIMPKSAPVIKKQNTLALGARIIEYDIASQDREEIAQKIADDEGRIIVPAFDDKDIIAGQGTIGIEIIKQCRAKGFLPDAIIAPIGGGGLVAGVGLAIKSLSPQTKILAAEPIEFDDQYRSLQSGRREKIIAGGKTICDALMSPMPGRLTFALNKKQLSNIFRITDAEIILAMQMANKFLNTRLEPSGAIALAACMGHLQLPENSKVCVILSGGNIDDYMFKKLVQI